MAGGVDGLALGTIAAGGLFLYAAVSGKTVLGTVQALVKGQSPSSAPSTAPATLTGSYGASQGAGSGSTGGSAPAVAPGYGAIGSTSAQQALNNAATAYGWGSGAQWQALQNVEMAEAGFNPNARNPASGAYGLAQALGHGQGAATAAADGTNEYGGYGLSDAEARAANSGDANAQAIWMCQYIAVTYGTPENAWAHEQQYHWY